MRMAEMAFQFSARPLASHVMNVATNFLNHAMKAFEIFMRFQSSLKIISRPMKEEAHDFQQPCSG